MWRFKKKNTHKKSHCISHCLCGSWCSCPLSKRQHDVSGDVYLSGFLSCSSLQLDPVEKEWIYSAACGRLSHLKQLLKQDVSLANKKVPSFTFTALHLLKHIFFKSCSYKLCFCLCVVVFFLFTPNQDFTSVSSCSNKHLLWSNS